MRHPFSVRSDGAAIRRGTVDTAKLESQRRDATFQWSSYRYSKWV